MIHEGSGFQIDACGMALLMVRIEGWIVPLAQGKLEMSFAEIYDNKLKNGSTESFKCSKVQVEVQIAQYKHLLSNFSISVSFPQTYGPIHFELFNRT